MIEAMGVEQRRAAAIMREHVRALHRHHGRTFDMGASAAEPIERHEIDARNARERAVMGQNFLSAGIIGTRDLRAVDRENAFTTRLKFSSTMRGAP